MKRIARFSLPVLTLTLTMAVLICTGCSSKPSDSQLTASVQKQIGADPALQGQTISVAAKDGTVTLSGTVSGQGSRELASNDAAKVQGVRTVVNDIAIGNPAAPGAAAANTGNSAMNEAPGNEANNEPAPNNAPPPPAAAVPATSAPPQAIVIPAGTRIQVRLGQTISTKNSQTGDSFAGTLTNSIRVGGQTVVRPGASASGTVVEDKSPGRFKGAGILAVRLTSLRINGSNYPIRTNTITREVKGKGKRSTIMTGGGAGLGAIIGGVAGGGKGALIGGLVGGGGGAAGSAFTGNKELELPAEQVLTFTLRSSVALR